MSNFDQGCLKQIVHDLMGAREAIERIDSRARGAKQRSTATEQKLAAARMRLEDVIQVLNALAE